MTLHGIHPKKDPITDRSSDDSVQHLALERRIAELERERRELWLWVEHLERLAEGGLHARGLAHDLGNALTAILTSSELAGMRPDAEEDRRTLEATVTTARKAAERLHAYIAFTRRDTPSLGPVTVADVLDDTVRFLAYPLRKAEMEVLRGTEGGPRVAITHPRLLQVLTHAVMTLIRGAKTPGGRITVDERVDGRDVVVDLRRVACSDPEETREPDSRLASTGFELHLAREILERAGGRILGEPSDGLTGTVRLVLPVAVDEGRSPFSSRSREPSEEQGNAQAGWRAWSGGWSRG